MSFIIRPFNIDTDIPDTTVLTIELGYPSTEAQITQRMKAIQAASGYHTFVAVADHKVIGYIGINKQLAWEQDGTYFKIQALVVKQEYRKEGVGAALIQHTEAFAKAQGATYLLVNSGNRAERTAAHRFYQNQDFEPKSTGFRKVL
ncbi:GNAT family N-acetyltransferase [Chitinophaga sancti]|uniref:GNAT family N-acetyltransferase n=1 Tax=Chitinophaga sancti TaxID=1004 RepID=UPI002A759004|nr:GNAT family N-acetyltransferase [Chitinophaga sancti]WPQ61497.1 GNAT family N-acetyltransferase [Chitinophaga sancti]